VKSRACALLVSETAMPRSSAIVGALTSFTSSSVCPSKTPRSTWTVRSRVSRSATRPRYSTSTASTDVRSAIALAMRPRSRASGRNGPSASRSSGAMAGTFTALVTTPPVSAATTCSAAW
jgi:hypothetical protein